MNGMIAFNYYDGVLEGVCRDLHGMREAYFTLIAWDEEVDGRIFATVEINEGTIQALADVLSRTHSCPEREVWTPRNRPGDPADAAFMEALIAEARHRIRTKACCCRPSRSSPSPSVHVGSSNPT